MPVVILQVLRRFQEHAAAQRSYFLRSTLDPSEFHHFIDAFILQAPHRRGELEGLRTSSDSVSRTPFVLALTAFGEDFRGLARYVRARLALVQSSVQREMLAYLAMAHHYAQRPIPPNAFADLLTLPKDRRVALEAVLPRRDPRTTGQ